tara:strand:- start:3287 stop:3778 length:492 start_codon:yes stop_codon:yes gene_type:complete
MIELPNHWTFWYHSTKLNDWSKKSYICLNKTNSAEHFWGTFKLFTKQHFDKGIIFIMKEDVFPDWSDPANSNGGFISIKIDTRTDNIDFNNIVKIWIEHLISQSIMQKKINNMTLHGISISPKSGHWVLKLWLNEKIIKAREKLNNNLPLIEYSKFIPFYKKK